MKSFISLEIYVRSVSDTVEAFKGLFEGSIEYADEGFAIVWLGPTRIILNALKLEEFNQPNPVLKEGALEHLGSGLEVVVSVDDIEKVYQVARQLNLSGVTPIQRQEWGLHDFRFLLSDGYYIRVTEPDDKVSNRM